MYIYIYINSYVCVYIPLCIGWKTFWDSESKSDGFHESYIEKYS